MQDQFIRVFVTACLFVFTHFCQAQSSVVVIPLFGDDPTPLQNIISVSPSGGDFSDPISAMQSIATTGSDAPASDNHYLIVVGPGEYALDEQLVMRPFVSITGSGVDVTRLIGEITANQASATAALVVAASNSQISQLSIVNRTVQSGFSIGIYASSDLGVSAVYIDVDAQQASVTGLFSAFATGGANDLEIRASSAAGDATGVTNQSSPMFFNNLSVLTFSGGNFSTGISNSFSAVRMRNARIQALGGENSAVGVSNFDDGTAFINKFSDSRVIVSAGANATFSYGILNDGSSPQIDNVRLEVDGSDNAIGVRSTGDGFPRLSHCSIDVSSEDSASGILLNANSETTTIRHCDVIVDGDVSNTGMNSLAGSNLRISHTTIKGGFVSGAGSNRCTQSTFVSSTDNFTDLTATCQIPLM